MKSGGSVVDAIFGPARVRWERWVYGEFEGVEALEVVFESFVIEWHVKLFLAGVHRPGA